MCWAAVSLQPAKRTDDIRLLWVFGDMETYIADDPTDVGILSANGIVAEAEFCLRAIKKLRRLGIGLALGIVALCGVDVLFDSHRLRG